MVRVTEQAATALQELLEANDAPPEAGVRLTPSGPGNIGMVIDAPHEGDEVVRRDEKPVVIVYGVVAGPLTDMVVDYQSSKEDRQTPGGFVLREPPEEEK
jgi:Fe-S cluster assembly iron-binding protein IscA